MRRRRSARLFRRDAREGVDLTSSPPPSPPPPSSSVAVVCGSFVSPVHVAEIFVIRLWGASLGKFSKRKKIFRIQDPPRQSLER